MNKFTFSLKQIIIFGICYLSLSCAKIKNDEFPEPVIESGIVRLSGKITNFQLKQGESGPMLKLFVPHPVTAEPGNFETYLNDDGSFHFDVPVECNNNIGFLSSGIFNKGICVSLAADNETKLEIIYDDSGNIKANAGDINKLTSEDMEHIVEVMGKMINHVSPERIPRYNMLIEDFIPFEIEKSGKKTGYCKK